MSLKEKIRRKIKYYRVGFHQSDRQYRINMLLSALGVLVYLWWVIVIA